ncbi:MAG: M81 family metallopeptidase [Silicimonas sp.]|nr:M81 family metallopeptidase [Silicimonas sp.]
MSQHRIAIAGFQHETNTFMPTRAGIEDFRVADSWPALLEGQAVIDETKGMNLPIAGAARAAEKAGGIELCPLLWCAAEPSGLVTDDAFDTIADMILSGLAASGPLDAIYLDLHGAMVTESQDDGEAALVARIRQQVGPDVAIGVSLDLHANISARLVQTADLITIYRTYPHLDMADTGARCMTELTRKLAGTSRRAAFRQAPFLVPLQAQFTGADPCRSLYRLLDDLPACADEYVDLAMGFPAADVPDSGPSVIAYAPATDRAEALAEKVMTALCAAEAEFETDLLSAEDAVRKAMSMPGSGPVIIADVQDNAGAGASSDTTGLLRALVGCEARNALLGVVWDGEIAARAHDAGVGEVIDGELGGKSGIKGDAPFRGQFKVLALSNGEIPYTGQMYGGGIAKIGPSCLLQHGQGSNGVRIVVSSGRTQCLDRAFFTHFGEDPSQADIVCVKSTVHFRADFEPGSRAVINAKAPGGFPCSLDEVQYKKLRGGVRQKPV